MHTYSAETVEGSRETYTDHKRLWWNLSLVNPLVPLFGVANSVNASEPPREYVSGKPPSLTDFYHHLPTPGLHRPKAVIPILRDLAEYPR